MNLSLYITSFSHVCFAVEHHPLRLADGWKLGTGRVEIWDQTNDTWKVICPDDWDLDDSNVVCHQLGYPGASRWYLSHANQKGVFFDGLGNCHGNESFLDDCLSASHECFDFDATVAVECKGVLCITLSLLYCAWLCACYSFSVLYAHSV